VSWCNFNYIAQGVAVAFTRTSSYIKEQFCFMVKDTIVRLIWLHVVDSVGKSHTICSVCWLPMLGSQVKVKVTLRLTVSQSVCLGVEPNLGLLTRVFFFKVTVLSFLGRPLWREVGYVMCQPLSLKSTTVSHYLQLFISEFKNLHSVKHIYKNNKIYTIYTGLVQSRLCTADYALFTSYLVYQVS
jgi:hypothetical protein